jgi:hypothetical protein
MAEDTPKPYVPVPGMEYFSDPSNQDKGNTVKAKVKNTSQSEAATTSNEMAIGPDGKVYTGTDEKASNVPAATIVKEVPTVLGAQGPRGEQGPPGPQGPIGPQGPEGVVDYDLIRAMIEEYLNLKDFKFVEPTPTFVYGTRSVSLPVQYIDVIRQASTVVNANYTLGVFGVGTITNAGLLTANDVWNDQTVTVTANYTDSQGKSFTASTDVQIRALKVVSLAVGGPSSIASSGTGTFTATATFNDGSSQVVTSSSTFSIQSGSIGTLAGNVLTAPAVGLNVNGVIAASYTYRGTTVTGTRPVTVTAPPLKAYYGSAAIPGGFYGAINWANFVLSLTPGSTTKATQFDVNVANGQYGWYAVPVSFGITSDQQFLDRDSGLLGGGWGGAMWENNGAFTGSVPRNVTLTINGVSHPYYLFRTDYNSLGSTHWQIN